MKKVLVSFVLMFSGIFSLVNADCYLVYTSKVTSSLGGPSRHGPMSSSKCNSLMVQQAGVVGSSNVSCDCPSGGASTSGYSGKDAWKYEIMKSFMDGLVKGMENAQRLEEQRAQEAKQMEEKKRVLDEYNKKKAAEKWGNLKLKEAQTAIEEARKKKADADAFSNRIGSSMGGLQVVPIGGGTSFFGSRNAATQGIEFKRIGAAKYDASRLKSLPRAMCSAYFSNQALLAGSDLEKARYYNSQADKVTAGKMYEEECKIPVIPEPPEPKQVLSSEDKVYLKKMETMTLEIQQDIKQLQLINTKLKDNELKIQEAQEKKEKAEETINEIQAKATTPTPEELSLIAEANALFSEAKNESQILNQEKEKLIDEQNQIQNTMMEKYRSLEGESSSLESKGELNEKR